ncbi:BRI1 kinase inhibitor 1 [Phalaenopsis equestris]|uniref:BRI1 kinase inhibitor 1 n=1 Tax=Phalaenopsis equestris TaxID=78828 RepID=UPI0009E60A2D|nr:BRI1 kinase inhibitor 1 [Phalaenopsis equestris]
METERPYNSPATPESTPTSPPPPPSLNSSPSHEFSFTISLHPPTSLSSNSTPPFKLTKPTTPIPQLDLSPADDIFFHGHLLPLQLLSHRPSNASIETEHRLSKTPENKPQSAKSLFEGGAFPSSNEEEPKERRKTKPFSPFFALRKWLRGNEDREAEKQRKKKKMKLFGRLWKKYTSLMEPLLFFKVIKEKRELRRSSYSFSGNCNPRDGGWRRRWRGDFSAPASMRTSPANSGLLVAPTSTLSSSDESTMEELQNAIQAAIAHCKSSAAVKEDKCMH